MTDHGDHFSVEISETNLDSLVKALREHGRRVLICDQGAPVAELTALHRPSGRLASIDPRMKVTLAEGYDPTAPLDDWPEHLR